MTPEQILEPIIKQNLSQYQAQGRAYKLKSKSKTIAKKIIPHIIFFVIGLLLFEVGGFLLSIAAVIFAVLKITKTTDTQIILELAKKNPKTPIQQLIAQEVVTK